MNKVSVWSKSRWVTFIIDIALRNCHLYCTINIVLNFWTFYILLSCNDVKNKLKSTFEQSLKSACIYIYYNFSNKNWWLYACRRVNQFRSVSKHLETPPINQTSMFTREGGGLGLSYTVLGVKMSWIFCGWQSKQASYLYDLQARRERQVWAR